ncbi:MAG TPA: GNAT family N-acetyltransferase [Dermatophilaceae bacterium]|nr:GNAT family N-acetyltransferase [Dermatophilaceae bacterium]
MAEAPIVVTRLTEQDWATYREIRLEMLHESAFAFGSRYADAAQFDERHWRQRVRDNGVFLATLDGVPVGSATYSEAMSTNSQDAELVAMWVAPASRGTSAARLLVEEVLAEAARRGRRRVLLSVVETNEPARRLYRRCGFVETGNTEPHPNDACVNELRMARDVQIPAMPGWSAEAGQ